MNSGVTRRHLALDLSDSSWTPKAFPAQIDAVVHLAQSRRFRDFPDGAKDVFGVNVHATARLLDYALRAGATHFVYASSGGLYRRDEAPLTENAPLELLGDLGFYLGSKAAAEILSQGYASLLTVIILRPFFIYGPGQGRDMLIPRIFDSVKDGRVVRLDGQNGLLINPVHVEDAAAAVIGATKLGQGAVINVAGPETLSLLEIALSVGERLGSLPTFEQTGQASRSLVGSIDLMAELLHYPQRRLRDSIDDIARVQ
jgi:nucleoside-diphosphate-sugar epimerase